jgi:hypothetical protein
MKKWPRKRLLYPVWNKRITIRVQKSPQHGRSGMKAQWRRWGWSRLEVGTVNTAQQPPRVSTAISRLEERAGGRAEPDCRDQRETEGTARALSAVWAKIIESSLWRREWTHRGRFKNTISPELIGFFYSIPQAHWDCPQFQITQYWITGLEK